MSPPSTCSRSARDWRATSISDGVVIVRHRELSKTVEMADRFAADLHLYAG